MTVVIQDISSDRESERELLGVDPGSQAVSPAKNTRLQPSADRVMPSAHSCRVELHDVT